MSGDIESEVGDFNSEEHQPTKGQFDPIPAGWYPTLIGSPEVKKNSKGTGSYLKFDLTIQGDKFPGRKVFARITLKNPNETAQRIGEEQLGALGVALGIARLKDSSDLSDKMVMTKIKITPASKGFDAGNDIVTFKAMDSATTASEPAPDTPKKSPTPAPASKPSTAAKGGKMPWLK